MWVFITISFQDISLKAVEDLSCPNLGVAAVLAIEPVVWQQASWFNDALDMIFFRK